MILCVKLYNVSFYIVLNYKINNSIFIFVKNILLGKSSIRVNSLFNIYVLSLYITNTFYLHI